MVGAQPPPCCSSARHLAGKMVLHGVGVAVSFSGKFHSLTGFAIITEIPCITRAQYLSIFRVDFLM